MSALRKRLAEPWIIATVPGVGYRIHTIPAPDTAAPDTGRVHNAIVHNVPDGGSVWATTTVLGRSVELAVENTGEELAPELVSTLAEPFRRGTDRVRSDHAGVGLGLTIVKSIVQAHEGTLTLTPRPGGGLRIAAGLPAERGAFTDPA